jgi:MSHA biogenesis protein MshQ
VAQAAIGASGNKTATAASNADVGATHTLALQSTATTTAPGSFNAFETSTAANAITGKIFTKIGGTAFSIDVVAITAGAQANTFSGFVKLELLANTGATPGAGYGANNCPTTNSVIQTVASAAIFTGRSTVNFLAVGNVYRDVRVRISYPTTSPTVTTCSTDSFVIRPASITPSASDNDALTAGITRTLNNIGAIGGNVHNAGRPFTLRAQAFLSDGTTTATNYDGIPTLVTGSPSCVAPPASCVTGALTPVVGAWSGTGTRRSDTASYSEAGVFTLQLEDQTYASVDSADGSLLAIRTVPSTASITAGRFIPDHFTVATVPASAITNRVALGCGGSFSYMGEGIGLTMTLEAHQFPTGITTNYKGTLAKLDPTVPASFSFGAKNVATNLTTRVSVATTAGSWSAGSAAITGTLSILRNTPDTPDGPLAAAQFGIAPVDADGVAMGTLDQDVDGAGGNDHKTVGATTEVRFGRLRLKNALGSERLALAVPMQIEFWNGTGFIVSNDSCTTLSQNNIVMSNYNQNVAPATPCKTAFPGAAITFTSGVANPTLAATGVGNNGSVDLRVRLSASSAAGNYCASVGAGTQTAAAVAPLSYLLGRWNSNDDDANANTAYDDDPVSKANFGIYGSQPRQFIYQRENY